MIRRLTATVLATLLPVLSMMAGTPRIAGGAYYGTNYTVPFAHAYRTLDRLGVDHRKAIDRDTYHMARLGLNAFRLHLWDVELSDSRGNLLDNDHLHTLDYLLAQLKRRGIAVVLTAQTNFGNGYPERNTDPNGAYSYKYEKCRVHDDPAARQAQETYLRALAAHVNPHTGLSYADDPGILAVEINNEPCHSGTEEEITAYINRMADALRQAGWKKEILYNVSHNLDRTPAFYRAGIDGTTYQWYPTGLVKGERRRGNFLPVLDNYGIPFDTIAGFGDMTRVIYEYDPADVLETYLYPAAARTFRKAGFDWVTQFAYDPIDMAAFNSEYQTHFLNLAYTPGKAIGMMIAAEVMRRTPSGKDYGCYPADTVFGDFTISARRNLAALNDGVRYYHTNTTDIAPKNLKKLRAVAGVGSSPLVTTDGTGAYFADLLPGGVWRLEIMPDVYLTTDPFTRPSPGRKVGRIMNDPITLDLDLPGLPEGYSLRRVGSPEIVTARGRRTTLLPGVWLAGPSAGAVAGINGSDKFGEGGNMTVDEYAASVADAPSAAVVIHTPARMAGAGGPLTINAEAVAATRPDSVVVYPADVSFWSDNNRLYRMTESGKHGYTATVGHLTEGKKDNGVYRYNIVVFDGGRAITYPGAVPGTPLDWDFPGCGYYETALYGPSTPVVLLRARENGDGAELSTIPEAWSGISFGFAGQAPAGDDVLRLTKEADAATDIMVISKYIGDIMANAPARGSLRLRTGAVEGTDSVTVALVSRDGFTYSATVAVTSGTTATLDLASLRPDVTLLTPAPYPSFLGRTFTPAPGSVPPFDPAEVETLTVRVKARPETCKVEIAGIWLK